VVDASGSVAPGENPLVLDRIAQVLVAWGKGGSRPDWSSIRLLGDSTVVRFRGDREDKARREALDGARLGLW
jgi:hypothetical protein